MRRHIPTLAEAFRFYGAFVWLITALVAMLLAAISVGVGVLEGLEAAAVLWIPGTFALLGGCTVGTMFRRVGQGLHAHRPWARYAALALSVIVLGDLPFGLPLGLLGLGVLLDGEAAQAFHPEAPAHTRSDAVRRQQKAAARARQIA